MEYYLYYALFGAVAGWLAGQIMKGRGFGLIGNIVIGIIGAFVGGTIFSYLGISAGSGLVGSLISAVAGSIVLLFIIGLIKKV